MNKDFNRWHRLKHVKHQEVGKYKDWNNFETVITPEEEKLVHIIRGRKYNDQRRKDKKI